jgi:hypothetical protein
VTNIYFTVGSPHCVMERFPPVVVTSVDVEFFRLKYEDSGSTPEKANIIWQPLKESKESYELQNVKEAVIKWWD